MRMRHSSIRSRGIATLMVIFAIGAVTLIVVALQSASYRQAAEGRTSAARVRAKWAARAGLEATIARFGHAVEGGSTGSAYSTPRDLAAVSDGSLKDVRWEIVHRWENRPQDGPADAHAKVNINRMSASDLMELEGMTEDVAAAILDWIDEDDEVNDLGAEAPAYQRLEYPYEPRNGPIRSLAELELIRGVDPELVRGEDWNLNGILDPNENDGDLTWPPDDADGTLDAGWSRYITTESVDGGLAASGDERFNILEQSADAMSQKFGFLSRAQAGTITTYFQQEGESLAELIATPLTQIAQDLEDPTIPVQAVEDLENEQIGTLIDETTIRDPADGPAPGRVNINTCSREVLDYIEAFRGTGGEGAADLLIYRRDQRASGFANIMDLLDVMSAENLAEIARSLTVRSNAYVVTCRGVDTASGIDVELVATIERTALPIVIRELRIR